MCDYAGGFNNNPSCRQFIAIFGKMIVHSRVSPYSAGNAVSMDSTHCLRVNDVMPHEAAESTFMDNIDRTYSTWISPRLALFAMNIVTYIAGFVVRQIVTEVCCDVSKSSLVSNAVQPQYDDLYQLLKMKNKGGLVIPSRGIVHLLTAAEKGIRLFMKISNATNVCSRH